MPNVFKFNTSTDEKSLKKGNFSIGVGDVAKGRSIDTGFYNGITPPLGGWTIYHRRGETNNFGIYTASADNLVSLTNQLDGKTFTQVWQCLNHFAGTSSRAVLNKDFPPIVTEGLIMMLDSTNTLSYPLTGSSWYDISPSASNGTLSNGPGFTSSDLSFIFDGTNDTVTTNIPLSQLPALSDFSIECMMKIDSYPTAAAQNQYGSTTKKGVIIGSTYYSGVAIYWRGNSTGTSFEVTGYIRGADQQRNTTYYQVPFLSKYYHFTIVNSYTTGKFTLYVNGASFSTINGPTQQYNSSLALTAGNIGINKNQVDGGGTDNYTHLASNITLAKIYTKALTPSEVSQNYFSEPIVADGLVFLVDAKNYRSYSGSGNNWVDISRENNTTTINTASYNSLGYFTSVESVGYASILEFTTTISNNLNSVLSATSGGWSIEEWILINDTTYPEAGAGTVVSNSAYHSGAIGFDWNHGQMNMSQFQMGASWNVNQPSGYDVRGWINLQTQFTNYGKWYLRHMYWNRDSSKMGVYYNGIYQGEIDISALDGYPLCDGGTITWGQLYGWRHDGARAGMKIYNKILTPSQILQNFEAGRSHFGI